MEADKEFVQKFTPPDNQAKNFTPSISPNFNSFSGKKHKKWVKMEKFTPLAKFFFSLLGPYLTKKGSLLGPYLKAWGSLLVLETVGSPNLSLIQ